MKLNKKGFTLIELLVTILIVGLVIGFSAYGIISIVNDSREQAVVLSENSLKEAARTYSTEVPSDSWKTNDEYDYFCVTVGELMNKGLLDKNAKINGNIQKNDFVIVKRNKVTFVNIKEEIATSGNNYELCTGSVSDFDEVVTSPVVGNYSSTTDKIVISFTPGSASYNGESVTTSYKCLYGTTSSNLNKEGTISGNACVLEGLKNNTNYYAIIYMNTINGSSVPATGNNNFKTTNFNKPNISQSDNDITITYNNKDSSNNVINPVYHYFKTTYNGTSNVNVSKCTNTLVCSGTTKSIEKNVWYKVSGTVVVSPTNKEAGATVYARTYDGSNNYIENSFEVEWIDDSPPDVPTYVAEYIVGGSYTSEWTNKEVMTTISSGYSGSGNINFYYQKKGDKEWTKISGAVTRNNNIWSIAETWDKSNNGDYTYVFMACNESGKCSDPSEDFNIKYDTGAPTITSVSKGLNKGPEYNIFFNYLDDLSGVDTSSVVYKKGENGTETNFPERYVTDTSAESTFRYNSSGINNKSMNLYLKVCDEVGNCAQTVEPLELEFPACPSGYEYNDCDGLCPTHLSCQRQIQLRIYQSDGTYISNSCKDNENHYEPHTYSENVAYCSLKGYYGE